MPAPQNMFISTRESSMVSFHSLKCPSLPNFLSVCVFFSLVIVPRQEAPCPLPRTDAPNLSPQRPGGLGILRALLKFKLMRAELYVSCYFTCVPFSSCHWNVQVSGILPDHLQISSSMCSPFYSQVVKLPKDQDYASNFQSRIYVSPQTSWVWMLSSNISTQENHPFLNFQRRGIPF